MCGIAKGGIIMKSQFAKGGDFVVSEIKSYIDKNAETVIQTFPYEDGSSTECTRNMLDVDEFMEFLNNI